MKSRELSFRLRGILLMNPGFATSERFGDPLDNGDGNLSSFIRMKLMSQTHRKI